MNNEQQPRMIEGNLEDLFETVPQDRLEAPVMGLEPTEMRPNVWLSIPTAGEVVYRLRSHMRRVGRDGRK